MELKYGQQIELNDLKDVNIDLFLFAGNHEMRVFTALNRMKDACLVKEVIMLCYKVDYNSITSDDIKSYCIDDVNQIYNLLDDYLSSIKSKSPVIAIDYSCMTKPWYYAFILYLTNKQLEFDQIRCIFVYTPSNYSPPQHPQANTEIAPLPGKYSIPNDKPKALIVCLGYEQNKAEGIIEHLDPKDYYLFYTKPSLDHNFVSAIETNNKELLARSNNIFTYPFADLRSLERTLTGIYLELRDDFSVIIAPLGPKPFTFVSMLLSVKYNDIDIWRVGSGGKINEYDRKPFETDQFIICDVLFQNLRPGL